MQMSTALEAQIRWYHKQNEIETRGIHESNTLALSKRKSKLTRTNCTGPVTRRRVGQRPMLPNLRSVAHWTTNRLVVVAESFSWQVFCDACLSLSEVASCEFALSSLALYWNPASFHRPFQAPLRELERNMCKDGTSSGMLGLHKDGMMWMISRWQGREGAVWSWHLGEIVDGTWFSCWSGIHDYLRRKLFQFPFPFYSPIRLFYFHIEITFLERNSKSKWN